MIFMAFSRLKRRKLEEKKAPHLELVFLSG